MKQTAIPDIRQFIDEQPLSRYQLLVALMCGALVFMDGFDAQAMGFVAPVNQVLESFGVQKDARGNAKADTEGARAYVTSVPKVFAAGDSRRGQSLVVWAIREGRQCARAVDEFLMGASELPR